MTSTSNASMFIRDNKIVEITGHERHRHNPSPISPEFSAPEICKTLRFSRTALAASIARTATLINAPIDMLDFMKQVALSEVELFIEDGSSFLLTQNFKTLADSARSSFAGRVGAGITDLLMNALGYTWRDNAACLAQGLEPHADFIYADGAVTGHGIVLAEARGSFAASATEATTNRYGRQKYDKQVKPHLGKRSPHGPTVHGYSISFGSNPAAPGAFLHVSETDISEPPATSGNSAGVASTMGSESTKTSLALASYRSNFALMNAPTVVAWIDWIREGRRDEDPSLQEIFIEVPYDGRRFLMSTDFLWPYDGSLYLLDNLPHIARRQIWQYQWYLNPRYSHQYSGRFVMEVNSAERFLNSLSEIIRRGREVIPDVLELPRTEAVGFDIVRDDERPMIRKMDYVYALYRDGLALLGNPPSRRIYGYRIWSPKDGIDDETRDLRLKLESKE